MLRRLGSFDAALIVMGGIVGSGIFLNPAIVAGELHSARISMAAWIVGGLIALLGAGLFAELAARRPSNGGFYAYLRDAFHPSVAFVYGWTLLLVAQSGGIAAGAVTFAIYVVPARPHFRCPATRGRPRCSWPSRGRSSPMLLGLHPGIRSQAWV